MRSHRLHIDQVISLGCTLEITGQRARYITRVLRLGPGTELTLFDGSGGEFRACIETIGRDRAQLIVLEHRPVERESPLAVRLLQGVSRGERMDYAIQKATELGVTEIVPVLTEFGVVRLGPDKSLQRRRHWQGVIISACEQCGRNRPPDVALPQSLDAALADLPADGSRWLLLPEDGAPLGSDPGPGPGESITVLIGPEGGLSPAEINQARAAGFQPRHLGPRVLRTETAATVALALIQGHWGDLAAQAYQDTAPVRRSP
ncbi:MAG: 16S rRNA (uracil(1498)-N(3))-methyltransferase [Gammaproteobacteria bacterium]|nr:16S rRNA (uracil(1498)-N(3))-methyltransferase [Gammaproteobacteria bacterium]